MGAKVDSSSEDASHVEDSGSHTLGVAENAFRGKCEGGLASELGDESVKFELEMVENLDDR